jgi:hypothetical protein
MPTTKQWTLMFYFASDNPLGPTIVSQLKALKQAGFHPQANVIAYYDPPVPGTPTHIFDVNITEKIKAGGESKIGFRPNDPLVRNLVEDKLWGEQESKGRKIKDLIAERLNGNGEAYDPPDPQSLNKGKNARHAETGSKGANNQDEQGPESSLRNFLKFCSDHYPAENYMLFILGHGLVVGNEVFLFDESAPTQSLSLTTLGDIFSRFKADIKTNVGPQAEFQLVSFHSCSMSSLEVAYELKGTANYMLAAQCPTSVGSWPYRQILIRVLNDIEEKQTDVRKTLSKIFHYCLYNHFDFHLAGFSLDLCLCDLTKTAGIKEELSNLSRELIAGLSDEADPRAVDFILLAHWDSQSYWGEMYTDLYDFCFCLRKRCLAAIEQDKAVGRESATLDRIQEACKKMTDRLEPKSNESPDQLIVKSAFVGPAYQYAHGLSVYFPWNQPFQSKFWLTQYGAYKLMAREDMPGPETEKGNGEKTLGQQEKPSWKDFLQEYFDKTMRKTRYEELGAPEVRTRDGSMRPLEFNDSVTRELLEAMAFASFSGGELGNLGTGEFLGPGDGKVGGSDATGIKVGGGDATGGDVYFSTIKNHPPFTLAPEQNGGPDSLKEAKASKRIDEVPEKV